jgi:serine/threonine protein kinase
LVRYFDEELTKIRNKQAFDIFSSLENLEANLERVKFKLIDFGFSRNLFAGEKCTTFFGNENIITKKMYLNSSYGFEYDYSAVGIQVFYLIFGRYPFEGSNRKELELNRILGEYEFPLKDYLSFEVTEMIITLLDENLTQNVKSKNFSFITKDVKKFKYFRMVQPLFFKTSHSHILVYKENESQDKEEEEMNQPPILNRKIFGDIQVVKVNYTYFDQMFR